MVTAESSREQFSVTVPAKAATAVVAAAVKVWCRDGIRYTHTIQDCVKEFFFFVPKKIGETNNCIFKP